MDLFQRGDFRLHSGGQSSFKIDCDALSDNEISALAAELHRRLPPFGDVVGVPEGGVRLAAILYYLTTDGPLLIVDDVLTTGGSMERMRTGDAIGAVLFARGPCPDWITALFQMAPET